MNICIFNKDYWGGIRSVSLILADLLQNKRNSICFVSLKSESSDYGNGSKSQYILPIFDVVCSDENIEYFANFIIENKIDILINQHADNWMETQLCVKVKELTGVKLISALHFSPKHDIDVVNNSFFIKYKLNSIKDYILNFLLWFRWWVYKRNIVYRNLCESLRYCYDNSDKLVLLSERHIPLVQKMLNSSSTDKLVAINNSIIFNDLRVCDNKEKRVLWCGRLEFGVKRVDRMIGIWKRVVDRFPDWELDVMGSGDIEFFNNLAKQQGVKNINFRGFCNPQEYYNRGAILCMTSSTEGWGMVLVEAQANGVVPMVYNSYVSVADIIADGENGFLVKAFDEDDYVEKLMLLMRDEELRLRMAESAMVSVRKFDSEKIAQQWIDLFEKI